ncbi:hypothetical protein B0J18DRAFT_155214 [Chaetomium sp. MPI-SDFR-AT-0129]|nr:hypothetical protein B0J18DRAFT_155214 [Chaetomium sp. MPI-SDFR-AT-0129]
MALPTPEAKDRITCHVLDTTLGQPARNMRVKLELISFSGNPSTTSSTTNNTTTTAEATTSATASPAGPAPTPAPNRIFESQTDDDGRIKVWLPYSSATSSGEVPVYTLEDVFGGLPHSDNNSGISRWTLRFDSAGYFGGVDKTFYPEVEVSFTVREGERYHVPLLLAPYAYSTYRGS